MKKEAVIKLGMNKITDKAKKNHLKRNLLANIPMFGLTGAGFGAGYAKNPNKGMAIGGLAGAGLGAAGSYLGGKLKQKRLEKGISLNADKEIKNMNKKYGDEGYKGLAKDISSAGIGSLMGYYTGRHYGKLGDTLSDIRDIKKMTKDRFDDVKSEIYRQKRKADSMDLGKNSYSISKDYKKLTGGK